LAGGGLRVLNSTLRGLIESAYDIREFQVTSGPAWLDTDRYDVLARSQAGAAQISRADEMKATRVKLQALLADRFKLVVHHEAREQQEYALVTSRDGAKLKADDTPADPPNARTGIQSNCGHMTATQSSMTNLAFVLSRRLQRPVLDRTGLGDRYSFQLDWSSDSVPCADAADNAPSIFTALREQLGLRLDSIRGPVDTLVVDHAERPSDD
jgi:uncharacterized protein (TIGR03435 family)